MILLLGRLILKKMLMRPEVRDRAISALRKEAAKTETKIDDTAVDAFETVWEVVLPVILGKL